MTLMETQNLTKSFGDLVAVNDVNLTIQEEGVLSIIGPNGAGKTTLFNLITGYMAPDKGKILFKGEDITNLPSHVRFRKGISRAFQITSLFEEMTVLENLALGIQSRKGTGGNLFRTFEGQTDILNEGREIAKRVGLEDKIDSSCGALSHGDRKILDIGISLAVDPDVILFDEPTAGLTGEKKSRVVNLIADLSTELKAVVVEHDMDVVFSLADEIIVLNRGEILAQGPPEEIRENDEVQEAYLGGY